MKLLKQTSKRLRERDNKPFMDYYLTWVFEGKTYAVRIRPQFVRDYDKLYALSDTVPEGELLDKYIG